MKIKFIKNGVIKEVKVGISWTTLFFGFFVSIYRKQWLVLVLTYLSFGLANFYFMFAGNKLYAQSLITDGWSVVNEDRYAAFTHFGIMSGI